MTALEKAQNFLQTHGREIDQARFAHHFGDLPLSELLAALGRYQNPDGGFFGLEVDIAAPQSNPFAMEIALLICLWADAPRDNPLLQKAVAHLESTQGPDGGWRFVPEIYQHALPSWFQGWPWPNLNPACTLSGLLLELGLGSPALHARVAELFGRLEKAEDLTGAEGRDGDFYSVRPYAFYFIPATGNPRQAFYRAELTQWFIRQHEQNKLDSTHFFEYIRSPRSYAGQSIPPHILQARLDLLVAEQTEDGGWPSPYDPRWRPWITVNNLLVLRAFGKIA
jgi:hypothetical protein